MKVFYKNSTESIKSALMYFFVLLFVLSINNSQAALNIHIIGNYPDLSIQEAVNQALSGDTVLVKSGIYSESGIEIKKKLTLLGEQNTIIESADGSQIIKVSADSVVISGLEFKNVAVSYISDNAAIKLDDTQYCRIENNTFKDNFFAIYLAKTANCVIENNKINSNAQRESASGNGIHLWYCKNITIQNNYISGHRDGIYFEFVEDSYVSGNLSEKNLRYGLHFMFSNRCRYIDNIFTHNGAGVAVMYTHNVEMKNNRFEQNWGSASYGLLLKEITDSRIENNTFYHNSRGLYAESTNRVQVTGNLFEQNGWAVKVMGNCLDNRFERNNFSGNTFDVATNSRHNFNVFDSNYWDNYDGYDLNHDGIGDVVYRPVSLFSFLVEQNEPSLILIRSFFVEILNVAERILPVLTPETLVDSNPLMRRVK